MADAPRSPLRRPALLRRLLVGCALVALVWYAFSPTLSNEFTNWDDDANFVENEAFWGLGWSQVRWAWTTIHMGTYQPLGWIVYSTEFVFFELDPRGYHVVSVLLYAAFIAALYALTLAVLRRWRHPDPPEPALDFWAGAVVALYAVHPLRVELVAWTSAQSYVPAALFFVLATHAYVRACDTRPRPQTTWIVISFISFLAAVLCKAPAATLPALLVALDVYPLRRLGGAEGWTGPPARRVWLEKAPFAIIGVAGLIVAYYAKALTFTAIPSVRGSWPTHVAAACYSLWFYIAKTVVPTDLAPFYVIPHPVWWRQPVFLLALALTAVSGSALFFARRRLATLVPFVVASVAILLPMSGLVSISTQLVSDRHAFFATIPWIFPATAVLGSVARRGWRMTVAVLVTIVALVFLTIQTRSLAQTWQTSETLWTRALASPSNRSLMAYSNLGTVYQDRGEIDRAIGLFRAGLASARDPTDVNGRVLVHSNLAAALESRGRLSEAAAEFEEVLKLFPRSITVHYEIGQIFVRQGRYAEAASHFRRVLELNPKHADARSSLEALGRR